MIIRAFACVAIFLTMVLALGCDDRQERTHQSGVVTQDFSLTPSGTLGPASVKGTLAAILRFTQLPPSALAALRDSLPTFQPYDPAQYTTAVRARVNASPDEGLMMVRGDFQGLGLVDFVVAGHTALGVRVVALLSSPNGAYRVTVVSEGDYRTDSLVPLGGALVVLGRIVPSDGSRDPMDIVLIHLGDDPTKYPERWRWVPSRSRFLLIEPND